LQPKTFSLPQARLLGGYLLFRLLFQEKPLGI
jgi:hypothetical protein